MIEKVMTSLLPEDNEKIKAGGEEMKAEKIKNYDR